MLKWLKQPPRTPETPREYFAHLPVIRTPRLTLRPLTMRDARDMHEYARDPEVARHVLWSAHKDLADTKAYLRFMLYQYQNADPSSWGIVDQESGRVIGTIGFMAHDAANRCVEVGYSLGRAYWGKGMMTEALQAVLAECFESLRMNRVEAMHFPENGASGRVMEKCGMKHEGRLRGRIFYQNEARDVELWAMTKRDWERKSPRDRTK